VEISPDVMGIVNCTPDSFFDQSRSLVIDEAIALGLSHFDNGAGIVDVGGESTRPGAEFVEVDEEIRRVIPVIETLAKAGPVSVDTQKEAVARAAVLAGAEVINDVSSSLYEVAGELRVGYVAMHRQGTSATMQDNPHYDNVVTEVYQFLDEVATQARRAGVTKLWLDPGIGFGKTLEHNLALMAHIDDLVNISQAHQAGVLIGTSRKRFLGNLGQKPLEVDERLEGSIASATWAMLNGANMVRVHDVKATVQARELLVRPLGEVPQ
jgi:dihydropteroate synthase